MKTLKLGALAFAMACVGSAVAMDPRIAAWDEVEALSKRVRPHYGLLTAEQHTAWNTANDRVIALASSRSETIEDILGLKAMLQGYEREIGIKQRAQVRFDKFGPEADREKARRAAGLDLGCVNEILVAKKPKKERAPVDDIATYRPTRDNLEGIVDLDGEVVVPKRNLEKPKKDASFLTKLKSLPATCLHKITAHPFISVGCAVVVILAAAVYVVNKKAAQTDIRNTEDDDIEGDIIVG